ncbi:DNA cytosine methyltransferase [Enterococcus termitis]|uniref:DNA (cytosine-5-)-methyltransferase n=1 Tax=Enterococcus termitis TaxID=332950 RepID=A0A1E5GYA4_9ENTE|nr:DNA (cytosine-5-)-methyltransferase [Enterococcus termitis]OEG17612.1 DNA (cytosine-5-)-methyltransferase [Enterococcus termitis]OJG96547.1 restriction endonuclease BsuRI [Enterococcus termitis]
MSTTQAKNNVTYKDKNQRSRGKFKPALNLSNDEVKSVLMKKIEEETSKIIESEEDFQLIQNVNARKDKINVVSLFSGAGGLDLGTELAGLVSTLGYDNAMSAFNSDKKTYDKIRKNSIFHTIYTNDMFKEANETYRLNFSDSILQHQKDIKKVAHFPENTLMIGGFPCPGFSEAGPRLIDDERNFLYIHFIRALIQTQPAFFVAENVKGMMTLGKGEVLKQIIEDFASAGYTVTPHLVNARDYGVPQARERVFLIGVHKEKIEQKYGYHYELPQPTHGDPNELSLFTNILPWATLRDAISDLKNNPGEYFEGSYSTIYMSRNRKKSWDDQSFTIQASGRQAPQHPDGFPMEKIGHNKWIFHGENRRLSIKEISRIQTFPDWFKFSSGSSLGKTGREISRNAQIDKVYKQIGNAVPVLLAQAIIQPIADFLTENFMDVTK